MSSTPRVNECYRMSHKFNASHDTGGKAGEHVHTFRLVVVVMKTDTRFADFYSYERAVTDFVGRYEGECFNSFPEFKDTPPTVENICIRMHEGLSAVFGKGSGFMLAQVEFSDSPTKSFSVSDRYILRGINKAVEKDDLLDMLRAGDIKKKEHRTGA